MVDGFGKEVLPHPYHMPATPAPRRSEPFAATLNASTAARSSRQRGHNASRQDLKPTPSLNTCPVTVVSPALERVADAKLQRIDAELDRKFVEQLLLRDRTLRHAEAAKGSSRHEVGVNSARSRTIMRHAVRAGGMDGYAIGDGRAP